MRVCVVLTLCLGAAFLGGCKDTYIYVDAGVPPQLDAAPPLGMPCPWGDECYAGARCVEAVCTVECSTSLECHEGTDCRPHPHTSDALVCVDSSAMGEPCNVDPAVCKPGLFCYSRIQDDPDAYCTRECDTDRDCDARFHCQKSGTVENAERRVCVRRKFCSPCESDGQCAFLGGVCASDSQGSKFCTMPCIPPVDVYDPNVSTCPQPYAECRDRGDGRFFCFHRYGSCVGGTEFCSPCRTRDDCAPGAVCYSNFYSKERFCTSECSATTPCPAGYTCYEFNNECAGDVSCYAPGATCIASTSAPDKRNCDPPNPPQCLIDMPDDTSNPKYPTCYPQIAGPP